MPLQNGKKGTNKYINLTEILNLIGSKWYLILLVFIPCLALSLFYSYFVVTPIYSSTGKIYIMNKDSQVINTSDLSASSYLTRDYQNLISDRAVIDEVSKEINYKYSSDQIIRNITVENPTNTRFIEITVKSPSPTDSKEIVDKICDVSQDKIVELLGIDQVNIVRYGSVSKHPCEPHISSNVFESLFIGIIIYSVILLFLYLTNDKIESSKDVEDYLNMSVLGVIPFNRSKLKSKR